MRRLLKNNHGSLSFGIAFIFLFVLLVFLFSVAVPMLMNINIEFYKAGEFIINQSDASVQGIQDASMKAEMQDTLDTTRAAFPQNIEILGFFAQYAWIFIAVIVTCVFYILARERVETSKIV